MAEGKELIELKFRIYDGTDIAHSTYASSMTVATLKQKIVAEWPQDKTVIPKSINDLKLIHAGRVLENNKSLADSRITFGDLPVGVITMHVVVQPTTIAKNKTEKSKEDMQKLNSCRLRSSVTILLSVKLGYSEVHFVKATIVQMNQMHFQTETDRDGHVKV
ncbi:Membrane-anchored ubiquitin-fold 3 [Gossypium arboreum]|uniref:Membrane-anchored ubiquitin-fold 3 n=1 Tax=Gossypium arboreum TaxID=29729 RepID=A0A0B0NUC8_GOSAR|nr:Membrane-anchored ubiquitin-fold 3 [Gossypium arboreum]